MTLRASILCGLLAAILPAAWPAMAQDMRFLSDTPYVYFTKEDHALFNAAMDEALEKGADGKALAWSNPATRASGVLTPVKSFERKELKCRRLSIANKAQGRSSLAEYNFCKQASGKWVIAN